MKPRTRIQKEVVRLSNGCPNRPKSDRIRMSIVSSTMHTARKAVSSLAPSADTDGKASINLPKAFADAPAHIAERNLKSLIHANGYSGRTHIIQSSPHGKAIRWYATLWQGQLSRWDSCRIFIKRSSAVVVRTKRKVGNHSKAQKYAHPILRYVERME